MAVSIIEVNEFIGSDIDEKIIVEKLFSFIDSGDFTVKHRCYFLLRELASQHAVPYILKSIENKEILEEDVLRLIDITVNLKLDTPILLKRYLYSKNPYLVRGEVVALAKNGSVKSLKILLEFASSNKGRIIRRELFSEVFGYMIDRHKIFKEYIEDKRWTDQNIRGYLRDMELKGPKYNRLSVFPSNDYFALKARAEGLDYGYFKNIVESQLEKKSTKRL